MEHNSVQAFAEFAVLSSLCDVWLLPYSLAANSRVGNSHMVQMSVVVSSPAFLSSSTMGKDFAGGSMLFHMSLN